MELNKKREAELQRLKRDLEEQAMQSEQQMTSLRKKNQDAISEMSEQLDQVNRTKSKYVGRASCRRRQGVVWTSAGRRVDVFETLK